jgi:transcriptional regulator with XRE-family HTH domain
MATPKEPKATFPGRLRRLRLERGLSARALADDVGISDRQIYRYEWGTSNPPQDVIERLAKRLGRSPQWLLGWA